MHTQGRLRVAVFDCMVKHALSINKFSKLTGIARQTIRKFLVERKDVDFQTVCKFKKWLAKNI